MNLNLLGVGGQVVHECRPKPTNVPLGCRFAPDQMELINNNNDIMEVFIFTVNRSIHLQSQMEMKSPAFVKEIGT